MALFESLLALLLVSILLLKISGHIGAPYPTMLAFSGACVAALPWAAAIALGAIVAPPDAAAAAAVLTKFPLPRRTMAILQGESLLNDATALLIFTAAVAMATWQESSVVDMIPGLLVAAPGAGDSREARPFEPLGSDLVWCHGPSCGHRGPDRVGDDWDAHPPPLSAARIIAIRRRRAKPC